MIDNHLHNQTGIHPGHQEIIFQFHMDLVLTRLAINMGQRLMEYIVEQFRLHLQMDRPVLDPGDRKQVFGEIDQPHGIVID